MHRLAHRRGVDSALRVLDDVVGDRLVIGRVDRTELSKNVYRGLLAYRELLRTRPEWRGRVVHAVYNNPSREDLPAYREYTARIERLAEEIDDEFATDDWTPLLFDIGDDYPAALAIMRRSDVVFVNSIRDGMNLVVLEGLVLSERQPVGGALARDGRRRTARRRRASRSTRSTSPAPRRRCIEALIMPERERARARRPHARGRRAAAPDRVVPGPARRADVTAQRQAARRPSRSAAAAGSGTVTSTASATPRAPEDSTPTLRGRPARRPAAGRSARTPAGRRGRRRGTAPRRRSSASRSSAPALS